MSRKLVQVQNTSKLVHVESVSIYPDITAFECELTLVGKKLTGTVSAVTQIDTFSVRNANATAFTVRHIHGDYYTEESVRIDLYRKKTPKELEVDNKKAEKAKLAAKKRRETLAAKNKQEKERKEVAEREEYERLKAKFEHR